MPQWIKCSERMPTEKEKVLVFFDGNDIEIAWFDQGEWYDESEYGFVNKEKVTHWMPLPEAPKP